MGNCTRCQRTTTLLVECEECHEAFCEAHRSPTDHDCHAGSTDDRDGSGADDGPSRDESDPRVLYSEYVDPPATEEPDSGDTPESEEWFAGMAFDPTARVERTLRTAGVVAVVLVVGLAAGGFLWMGPGTDGLDGSSPDPVVGADDLNATQVERLVHEYTNEERRDAGVAPIEYDEGLAAIAEYHSRDMAERGYVNHTSPAGETIADRYREFGYACDTNGEVIQWLDYDELDRSGEEALARAIVGNWMDSALHRTFALNDSWTRQGVGVHLADSGRVYVTQNTCTAG